MSTRRARIKAVTSLPPRRKNTENTDNKPKLVQIKDEVEKVAKSPRTPKTSVLRSPVRPNPSPKSPRVPRSPVIDKLPTPTPPPQEKPYEAPPKFEKPAEQQKSTFNAKADIFLSPQACMSPIRRSVISSVIKTPRRDVDISIQRLVPSESDISNTMWQDVNSPNNKSKSNTVITANESQSRNNLVETKSDIPDDYSVPSVPESITEDTVMDGIVPLKSVKNAPKPIALLKNEIISENAEVLFDPIVPLPSPSKVRPKLRPVPRLGPHRRNSIQGSASESEDESRRALRDGSSTPAPPRQRHDSHTSHSTMHSLPQRDANRTRNDSVCSVISQTAPPPALSPHKEKHYPKTRRTDMSRRMAAMRKQKEAFKRDSLTMFDLIFYNPTSNPIIPDQDELNAKEANEKEKAEREAQKAKEEKDPPPDAKEAAPVPKIKLGPNGEIVLDEESLVIKQSESRKVESVVREGAWVSSAGRYRRTPRTADWSGEETVRFYRALAAVGTDFSLMQPLFEGRSRRDLKLKFKKEEKVNCPQVDKALRCSTKWDVEGLQGEFREERVAARRRREAERERLKEERQEEARRRKKAKDLGSRRSKASSIFGAANMPSEDLNCNVMATADGILQRHLSNMRSKRPPPPSKPPPIAIPLLKKPTPISHPPSLATLTPLSNPKTQPIVTPNRRVTPRPPTDMATISKLADPSKALPEPITMSSVSANIEAGSLVVLTVDDPTSPSKKMLQTYIANGGQLTPVALPPALLNSVLGYMKKGGSAASSPQLTSPSSVASDTRSVPTPVNFTSPPKRQRHSSFNITQL